MKSEKKSFVDGVSGIGVTQLTDYRGHSHHFYFTNGGWYAKGHKLLFASDRNNRTNLFGVDLETGDIEQLTDLEPVPLPREVEFLRASKNPVKDEVYFWHNLRLLALDIASKRTRILMEIEPRWCVSMTNVSADGRHVYFGSWEDQSHKFKADLLRGYVGFAETWAEKPRSHTRPNPGARSGLVADPQPAESRPRLVRPGLVRYRQAAGCRGRERDPHEPHGKGGHDGRTEDPHGTDASKPCL